MMFDQLTEAISSVAKKLGPKKRYVLQALQFMIENTMNAQLTVPDCTESQRAVCNQPFEGYAERFSMLM